MDLLSRGARNHKGEANPCVVGTAPIRLGILANWQQFSLLVLINALVGGMVGIERTVLPLIAEQEFGLASRTVLLAFVFSFGLTKALTNLFAGHLSDRIGRKTVLVAGWLIGLPAPVLVIWAPSWNWIVIANILLGVNQGLCWSTTVIMKIDLAGPQRRGLAMGLNEAFGYGAVALFAFLASAIAASTALRPYPFLLGIGIALAGLLLSTTLVRETHHHALHEQRVHRPQTASDNLTFRQVLVRTSWKQPTLFSVCQAGLVNNLNDGVAWGLFPVVFAASGMRLETIGLLTALYPAVWGVSQLATGALSDHLGRKPLIVGGMWLQALGIALVPLTSSVSNWAGAAILLGLGTALVYPTLLAAVSDVADPHWRASAVGVYRLWRDGGYAVGALLAGGLADLLGLSAAILAVAGLTALSGGVAARRMAETLRRERRTHPGLASPQ